MNSLQLTILTIVVLVLSTNAAPARKIYKMGIYSYQGRPAIFKLRNGKTDVYYYHLGYGDPFTKFTGGSHSCSHFKYEIGAGQVIYGFGYKCTLSSHFGTFEVQAGFRPYLQGINFLRVRL